jgi:hypothetical protein
MTTEVTAKSKSLRLSWHQIGADALLAAVGEEAQGRAGVRRGRDGWRWWLVDMLPDTMPSPS